uniref:Polysaccharide lyase 14 domain-containing protein n=1 Tax=Panagrolaimus superbus TaxID=310955 RepID=A0A914Z0J8_9BILA
MKESRWDESKADITSGGGKDATPGCRIKMLPNSLSEGGFGAEADIEAGQEYEIDFDMKFHSTFSWSGGGKFGFGFKIGQGNKTGCRPAWDGNGGSIRLVWIASKDRIFLRPYVYHFHQPNECGDNFGKTYPTSDNLVKGKWYHVHMYAKSNTGNEMNGWLQIVINETPLINQTIQWTANDEFRQINALTFMTFRGGSSEKYMAPTTDYVYYDNFVMKKIS